MSKDKSDPLNKFSGFNFLYKKMVEEGYRKSIYSYFLSNNLKYWECFNFTEREHIKSLFRTKKIKILKYNNIVIYRILKKDLENITIAEIEYQIKNFVEPKRPANRKGKKLIGESLLNFREKKKNMIPQELNINIPCQIMKIILNFLIKNKDSIFVLILEERKLIQLNF